MSPLPETFLGKFENNQEDLLVQYRAAFKSCNMVEFNLQVIIPVENVCVTSNECYFAKNAVLNLKVQLYSNRQTLNLFHDYVVPGVRKQRLTTTAAA